MYEAYPYRPAYRIHYGGLVTSDEPETLNIHESPDLLNVRPIGRGKYAPRNGIERIGDTTAGTGSLKSIYNFRKVDSEILMRSYSTKLQYLNSATWTDIPTSPAYTADLKFGFANDESYVFGGNGIDKFFRWDGAATFTEYAGNPKGNIFAFYLRRLCVAGDPANPATLSYSKTGNAVDFTFSAPRVADDGGSIVLGDGGDAITSLKSLLTPDGNSSLIVFKKSRRIYAVTFSDDGLPGVKEIKLFSGAVSDRSTVVVENDVWYLDENNNIQSLGYVENIQNNISKEQASGAIDNDTADVGIDEACGWYFESQKFAIFSVKKFNAAFNNVQYVYYTKYKSWWRWEGLNANQFADYQGQLVWASSFDLNVYGLTDAFDDLGGPIASYRSTRAEDLSNYVAGADMRFKQTRFIFVRGYISPNGELDFDLVFNKDSNQNQSVTITGQDDVVSPGVSIAFGRNVVGTAIFGGHAIASSSFTLRPFFARISYEAYGNLQAQIYVRSQTAQAGSPYIIVGMVPFMKLEDDGKMPDDNVI